MRAPARCRRQRCPPQADTCADGAGRARTIAFPENLICPSCESFWILKPFFKKGLSPSGDKKRRLLPSVFTVDFAVFLC